MKAISIIVFIVASLSYTRGIIQGGTADIIRFPYVVSLQNKQAGTTVHRGHSCGGALITWSHVLTTATCLYNYNTTTSSYVLKTPAQYRVFGGANSLTADTNANNVRDVQNFIPHPNFIFPPSHVFDIGIINLTQAFPSNAVIQRVPLGNVPATGQNCLIAGWGSPDGTAPASSNLLFAEQYIFDQQMCAFTYMALSNAPNIQSSMSCATNLNVMIVSSFNDLGNALVCDGRMVGVLTYFINTPNVFVPEVFTRTSNYTTWINSVTGSASAFSPGIFMIGLLTLFQMLSLVVIN